MALVGQDVEAVRNLASQLDSKANDISNIVKSLTSTINGVKWMGADADRFRNEWQSQHTAKLNAVVQALHDASSAARKNASEQEAASK